TYSTSDRMCFLKTGAQRATPRDGFISGLPITQGSLNFPGSDYRNFFLGSGNESLCEAACAGDFACQSFTFLDGTCYLKAGVPAADTSCTTCTSGMRRTEPNVDRPGFDYKSFTSVAKAMDCMQ